MSRGHLIRLEYQVVDRTALCSRLATAIAASGGQKTSRDLPNEFGYPMQARIPHAKDYFFEN